jgi:hypothetical protein
MLASHETRCNSGLGQQRRFDGVFKLDLALSSNESFRAPSIVIVARSSSHAPKSWYCGQEFLKEGIKIFADRTFASFAARADESSGLCAKFVALYDVHTRFVPTQEHTEAHTTNDPSRKSFFSRAHKFTAAVDEALWEVSQEHHEDDRFLLSIGLDGFACHASLLLEWLKRSPAFTFIIRETELVHGMQEEYFPKHSSGLYYGSFKSTDIEKSIESKVSTDNAVQNLLHAWSICQEWKDMTGGNNGRKIGRNGDHTVAPKKAKRGPKRGVKPAAKSPAATAL